ncbi:MAG TPA: hypothetical protein PKY59_10360 [Pyrinomonadaceae bacterium]|nr:hypothetical protein [Pyrinomonadaceae bacterium]
MGRITYNLNNGATLQSLVPTVGGVAALPPGLAGPGLYIIFNNHTNNRYVGKSSAVEGRFQPRMESVCELGFSVAQLNQILVFWGTVSIANTPPPGVGIVVMAPAPVAGYSGAPGNRLYGNIDGQNIELERLLIRFILNQFHPATITNNTWGAAAATYTNPTANPITVTLNWGAAGPFAPGTHQVVWGAGQAW